MAKNKKEQKKKVLFFDDEPFITAALTHSLELFGWKVTLVSEIDDLFKELKTRQFDILILDLMAPIPNQENKYINFTLDEIDAMKDAQGTNVGVILAKKIWNKMKKSIPILFLSAKKNPIPEDLELKRITCDYLRKPQFARAVDEKLKELLNIKVN